MRSSRRRCESRASRRRAGGGEGQRRVPLFGCYSFRIRDSVFFGGENLRSRFELPSVNSPACVFICSRIKKARAEGKKCHAKTMMSKKADGALNTCSASSQHFPSIRHFFFVESQQTSNHGDGKVMYCVHDGYGVQCRRLELHTQIFRTCEKGRIERHGNAWRWIPES